MIDQVLNFFISPAHAEAAAKAPEQSGMSFIVMFIIFFVFIYFAIWRPQNKRAKDQQDMMSALAKGDEVMLAGGMLGRIIKLTDQYATLAIANDVDVLVQKSSIVTVLPKGTLKSIA